MVSTGLYERVTVTSPAPSGTRTNLVWLEVKVSGLKILPVSSVNLDHSPDQEVVAWSVAALISFTSKTSSKTL